MKTGNIDDSPLPSSPLLAQQTKAAMKARKWSIDTAAKKATLGRLTVVRLRKGYSVRGSTLEKWAEALSEDPEKWKGFTTVGLADEELHLLSNSQKSIIHMLVDNIRDVNSQIQEHSDRLIIEGFYHGLTPIQKTLIEMHVRELVSHGRSEESILASDLVRTPVVGRGRVVGVTITGPDYVGLTEDVLTCMAEHGGNLIKESARRTAGTAILFGLFEMSSRDAQPGKIKEDIHKKLRHRTQEFSITVDFDDVPADEMETGLELRLLDEPGSLAEAVRIIIASGFEIHATEHIRSDSASIPSVNFILLRRKRRAKDSKYLVTQLIEDLESRDFVEEVRPIHPHDLGDPQNHTERNLL